ncbi:hypothetical protein AMECASPLE_001734, partial [Ameca splendens]
MARRPSNLGDSQLITEDKSSKYQWKHAKSCSAIRIRQQCVSVRAAVSWPAALHGQTSDLTETAGISGRDVTAFNSPTTWIKKSWTSSFLAVFFFFGGGGFQPLSCFLESEISTHCKGLQLSFRNSKEENK